MQTGGSTSGTGSTSKIGYRKPALGVGMRADAGKLGAVFFPGSRYPHPLSVFPPAAHTLHAVKQPTTAGFGVSLLLIERHQEELLRTRRRDRHTTHLFLENVG